MFVWVCAQSLGFTTAEKCGIAIILVGLAIGAMVGTHLTPSPFLEVENAADLERVSRDLERWLLFLRVDLLTICVIASLVLGSAGHRTWRQRKSLFPFLFGRGKSVTPTA